MSRLPITGLRLPLPQYRSDRAAPCERSGHSFETMAEARAEDLERAARIRAACWATDAPFDRDAALALADNLERSGLGRGHHESMTSKVYMGLQRICIGGALWQLVDEHPDWNTFTVRPRGWLFTAEELASLDPRKLIKALRSALDRQRRGEPLGFLVAAVHGEFDEASGLYDVHLHGVADPRMLDVVDRLRDLPNYRCRRARGDKAARVVIGRRRLSNLPFPLMYPFQAYWPKRWRGLIDGVEYRGNVRGRIPEPYHTNLLLWLDRWSLADITLLMGAHVGRGGLILNG